jgi:hypothetical protein
MADLHKLSLAVLPTEILYRITSHANEIHALLRTCTRLYSAALPVSVHTFRHTRLLDDSLEYIHTNKEAEASPFHSGVWFGTSPSRRQGWRHMSKSPRLIIQSHPFPHNVSPLPAEETAA